VWDDVFSVINIPGNNGGYTFSGYQWQENGVDMPGETGGNLYLANRPNALTATYTVKLVTVDGVLLESCPLALAVQQLRAYPNPVIDRLMLDDASAVAGDAVKIYNSSGVPVHTGVAEGKHTELNLSSLQPGVYVLEIRNERVRIVKK
jgi:hypothetical protein